MCFSENAVLEILLILLECANVDTDTNIRMSNCKTDTNGSGTFISSYQKAFFSPLFCMCIYLYRVGQK